MVKKNIQEEIQRFVDWLIKWKETRKEQWGEKDNYAIGIYACYLVHGDKHERT